MYILSKDWMITSSQFPNAKQSKICCTEESMIENPQIILVLFSIVHVHLFDYDPQKVLLDRHCVLI